MHDARTVAFALGSALPSGAGWLARCPVPTHGRGRGDVHPSLSVLDGEAGRLLVRCHAGCSQERVIAVLRSRGLWPERHWSRSRTPVAPTKSLTNEHHCRPTATAPGRDSGSSTGVSRIWAESAPVSGTPVERYLRSRDLDGPIPPSLRCHPRLPHRPSGSSWPAMVAAVQGADGRLAGVSRTWLRPDGTGKAPVEPPRMMLGRCAGGAVRLARAGHDLQVGEGLETCLAAMLATRQPTWAALSTSGLRALALPPEVRQVVILADGDNAGEAAAFAAAERWLNEGRSVRIARPPNGLDFADVVAGRCSRTIQGVV